MRKSIIVLFIIVTVSVADSLTLRNYMRLKERGDEAAKVTISAYVGGMGAGFAWSNTAAAKQHGIQLYCNSEKLTMHTENFIKILDDAIEKFQDKDFIKDNEDQDILGLLLLLGLQDIFPCTKK